MKVGTVAGSHVTRSLSEIGNFTAGYIWTDPFWKYNAQRLCLVVEHVQTNLTKFGQINRQPKFNHVQLTLPPCSSPFALVFRRIPTMAVGNRRHISADVKYQLVAMSASLKPSEIQRLTGISKRTVNRVLNLHRRTGCVVKKPLQAGWPRILNALDIAVRSKLL